jgi:hypothetical protein
MADPFQPKFVDLVRNFTTTTGTSNFVLGPAVNGFTGFASALQTGDSFYYSAIGVDKPQEREVGRGTLLAGGGISRDPISGTKTNFTTGTKSIALIAAAEWFNLVQAGAGSGTVVAASRAALAASANQTAPALLTEAGREGLFQFDPSDLSARVAADTAQGIHVAPASDPTGASGAWVRIFDGHANVLWWGATRGGADTSAAILNAKATLEASALAGFGYSKGTPRLYFPAGRYFMGTTTVELTHTMILEGDSSGPFGGGGTVLEWASNTTGIRSQRYNTAGASTGGPTQAWPGGDGSLLRNLYLKGGYAGTEGESHGIHIRSAISIENVTVENFGGDGVHANCSLASGGETEGSASGCHVSGLYVSGNRRGVYLAGGDANAGNWSGVHGIGNRQATIVDDSFLGNNWYGPSSHAAGLIAGSTSTLIHNNGHLFTPKRGTTGHSTNSPPSTAVDDSRWLYVREGVVDTTLNIRQWIDGISVREGGPFLAGASNTVTFSSPYAEWNQAPSQGGSKTLWSNFNNHSGISGGASIGAELGQIKLSQLVVANSFEASNGNVKLLGGNFFFDAPGSAAVQYFRSASGASMDGQIYSQSASGMNYWARGGGWHRFQTAAGDIASFQEDGLHVTGVGAFTGTLSASNLSGTNSGDQTITLTGDVTGSGTGSFAATIGNSKVTYAKIQNVSATSKLLGRGSAGAGVIEELGLAGGLTIASGNLSLGSISPSGVASSGAVTSSSASAGNGYATGAGGTVTQTTNKSNGVTLNRVCGQITMNNAALANGAVVEFTVTNSAVAATDTINLNLASGAATSTAYRYWVSAVAAGSFKIVVENRSGGSLSEALVLTFAVLKAVSA